MELKPFGNKEQEGKPLVFPTRKSQETQSHTMRRPRFFSIAGGIALVAFGLVMSFISGYQIGSKRAMKVIQDVMRAVPEVTMEARESNSVTEEAVPTSTTQVTEVGSLPTYTVAEGDVLSQISETECGRYSLYPLIAEINGIAGPKYTIYEDQTIILPCKRWSDSIVPAETAEPVVHSMVALLETPTELVETPARVDEDAVPTFVVETVPTLTDNVVVDAEEAKAEPVETIAEVVEIPTSTPTEETLREVEALSDTPAIYLPKGTYELVIAGDVIPNLVDGTMPSLNVIRNNKGKLNLDRSEVTANKVTVGNDTYIRLQINIEEATEVTDSSIVAFDYGGEKPAEIRIDLIKNYGNIVQGDIISKANLEKKRYANLTAHYSKPGKWSRIGTKVGRTIKSRKKDILIYVAAIGFAVPTAGASFSTIGWPAISKFALPEAVKFTAKKAGQAHENGMRLMNEAVNQQQEQRDSR